MEAKKSSSPANAAPSNRNRIVALILIVASLIGLAFAAAGLIRVGVRQAMDAKNSTVFIFTQWVDRTTGLAMAASGSGFTIGTGGKTDTVITNSHVIHAANINNGQILVVFSAATNDTMVPQVIEDRPEKDLAILRLPVATDKRKPIALKRESRVNPGDPVWTLGYPGISSTASTYNPRDLQDITVTSGVISKRMNFVKDNIAVYEMNAAIAHGNSGGPLVDSQGNVIGVNTFSMGDPNAQEKMFYAIRIDELLPLLRAREIPFALAGGFPWVSAILLAVALALGAVGVVLVLNKQGSAKMSAGRPASAAAGSGAGLAAGSAAAPEARKVSEGKPILRGVSGKYAGSRFDLGDNHLRIGRDPEQCNLVFDRSEAGISAIHCSLYFDRNTRQFVLEDLASSYGTFLGNGQKLPAHVPTRLVGGDTFYLANNSNRFVVSLE